MSDGLERDHNLFATWLFHIKAAFFRIKRFFANCKNPVIKLQEYSQNGADYPVLLGESTSSLWDFQEPREFNLTLGKIQNLRIARQALDGLLLPQNKIFSFWRQLGRLTSRRGYVPGRELREGCLVPSVGGGICQMTNALYDAACQAGFTILERSRHTKVLPNSFATRDRDATVFWNYVDLRFCTPVDVRLSVDLNDTQLTVGFWAKSRPKALPVAATQKLEADIVNSCDLCGQTSCRKALEPRSQRHFEKTVFFVDEFWPEYGAYLQKTVKTSDAIFLPIDGKRWNKPNYCWPTEKFSNIYQSFWQTLKWSRKLRALKNQGSARQVALLKRDQSLALAFAKKAPWDATHCVVMQNLLPELAAAGVLAGRTYDVLMTRLPLKILQAELNASTALWPESQTLSDFRVNANAMDAEWQALEQAKTLITPHTRIFDIFPNKTVLLDWQHPVLGPDAKTRCRRGDKIIFPATTVGRKGAYLVRALAKDLACSVVILGEVVEDAQFWQGVVTEHRRWNEDWWQDAAVIVLPAIIEHRPRAVLKALALGLPVLVSPAVGIKPRANLQILPVTDYDSWKQALQLHLKSGFCKV